MSEELFLEYETDASSSTGTIANDKRFSDIQSNLDIPNSWFRDKSSVYGRCSVNQNLFIYRTL